MIRFFDIFFSLLAIIVLTPFLVPICLILRFTGEGEVFYQQERVGRGRKRFTIYKFATMLKDSPNIGSGTVTVKDDPRVLPFGSWLRKTKVNELPQLLNVLVGDMSVIGPRPVTSKEYILYEESIQLAISELQPGLSGIGSVVFRDEEALMSLGEDPREIYAEYIAPYKGQLEKWYSENVCLLNYFYLIFLTIWVVMYSNSTLVWRVFKTLPTPSEKIRGALNYPL